MFAPFHPKFKLDEHQISSTVSTLKDKPKRPKSLWPEERFEGYKRIVLIPNLEQMMFVAGETGEPTSETTTLVEQIVHEQVLELVSAPFVDKGGLIANGR